MAKAKTKSRARVDPDLFAHVSDDDLLELEDILGGGGDALWEPLEGPQTRAYESKADIVGYGGAAGGGKSDLICGICLTKSKRALIIRREKGQVEGIVQRLEDILGTKEGLSRGTKWRVPFGHRPLLEFAGLDDPGDERRWQGRPHDKKLFDEVTEMREYQVRFLLGWGRTTDEQFPVQVFFTFNPPTTVEGRWVLDFFAPWLREDHPDPAVPGELRWFTTVKGKDEEVPDARPFVMEDGERVYKFKESDYRPEDVIKPKSRTFFPARVTDNPYYMATDYVSQLQSLPEPLRSQMLFGDFKAGIEDDRYQVIPTEWVEAAMARWKPRDKKPPMDSLGLDVAFGGRDQTVFAPRCAQWYDKLSYYSGAESKDEDSGARGSKIAGWAVSKLRSGAVIHIDLFGVGAEPYARLMALGLQVIGVNMGEQARGTDRSGRLRFDNLRSELWWGMREDLDPDNNMAVELPPDKQLLHDLTAPRFEVKGQKILVESREEIYERLRRSPDAGTAVIMARIDTPKRSFVDEITGRVGRKGRDYNPLDVFEKARADQRGRK